MTDPNERLASALAVVTSMKILFNTSGYLKEVRHRHYTVVPDDQSFLFIKNRDRNALPRTRLTTSIDRLYRAKVER